MLEFCLLLATATMLLGYHRCRDGKESQVETANHSKVGSSAHGISLYFCIMPFSTYLFTDTTATFTFS